MNAPVLLSGALALVLLTACGGGGGTATTPPAPSTYATSLAYQNPAAPGFSLVLDTGASTATHLVLDLVGPSGTAGKGVAFFLAADATKVAWTDPAGAGGSALAPGTVFPLGSAPQMLKVKAQSGLLQVGLFQKGGAATTLTGAPILSLALDLAGATVPKGPVSLALQTGKQAVFLDGDGNLTGITINLGALSAQ